MKNQKIILSSDEELFNDNKTNNNDQSCTSNHPSFDNDIENKTNNNNHSMGSHEKYVIIEYNYMKNSFI